MKKVQMTVVIGVLLSLLFSAANVFANPVIGGKPHQTPGAKATEKADDRATKAPDDHGNGQDGHKTPGAQATENAVARATEGQGDNKTPGAKATEKADDRATQGTGKPKGGRITYRGSVTAVGLDSLTLGLDGGGSKTFVIAASTQIRIPTLDGNATLADVHVGDQALVQVLKNDPSQTALFVKVVPGQPAPVHRVGTVTAYTPGVSITILDHTGSGSSTFLITPETKILPKDRANELKVGSLVTIISRRDPAGGPLTAQGIVIHPQEATEEAPTATLAPTVTATATP
jgi:hypothetical protein